MMISQKVQKICHFEQQREIFRRNFWARLKISPDGRNDMLVIRSFCEIVNNSINSNPDTHNKCLTGYFLVKKTRKYPVRH